ncbi:N-acetylmuramoyl-L-alanine amidase [Parvularcula marina]|uniref:N-acetylmuramoyl-L-alanine amidase n=2 Tax=Parvularcula marina TaxID=2292771 RepID=UPI003511D7A9
MTKLMKRALSLWSVAILTFCGILALAGERATAPIVENVRLGVHKSGHTRVVLDMDAAPGYELVPRQSNGGEIVILIENVSFSLGSDGLPASKGVVNKVTTGEGRVTIDLAETALPARDFVIEPSGNNESYRLVIDLEPVNGAAFLTAAADAASILAAAEAKPKPEPTKKKPSKKVETAKVEELKTAPPMDIPSVVQAAAAESATSSAPSRMTRIPSLRPGRVYTETPATPSDKLVIVIDPGHGGKDPGSIGRTTGLEEKRVTWSAAQALGKELTKRGYEVAFTRNGDEFIDLEERIKFARARQADMFVSIHADANPVLSVRGASVYTLSEDRSEKMAAEATSQGDFRLFDRELSSEDKDVSSILFDLANTDTKNQSERLAAHLVQNMKGRVKMVNNTHRHGGLVVLLSPDVPAVLVELAFMSNEDDEANLGSRTWRNNAAAAIADGIDDYFANGRRAGLTAGASGGN